MRRSILMGTLIIAAAWSLIAAPSPVLAQSRAQLGPLCTSDDTPADKQIDACNKIIALKVFSGEKLATVYFWRAVGWTRVRAEVVATTRSKQVPWSNSSLLGEVYLAAR